MSEKRVRSEPARQRTGRRAMSAAALAELAGIEPVFSTEEVARMLGISASHARRLCHDGVLVAADVAQPGATRAVYRIPASEVRAFVNARGLSEIATQALDARISASDS